MGKIETMTSREIRKKYGTPKEKAITKKMLDAAPEYDRDPNPGGRPIARGFAQFKEYINRQGRPKKEIKRELATVRIPSDALKKIKALGRGWSTRAGDALADLARKGLL